MNAVAGRIAPFRSLGAGKTAIVRHPEMFVLMDMAGENHRDAVFSEQRFVGVPHRFQALAALRLIRVGRVFRHRRRVKRMVQIDENGIDRSIGPRCLQRLLDPAERGVGPVAIALFKRKEQGVFVAERVKGAAGKAARHPVAAFRRRRIFRRGWIFRRIRLIGDLEFFGVTAAEYRRIAGEELFFQEAFVLQRTDRVMVAHRRKKGDGCQQRAVIFDKFPIGIRRESQIHQVAGVQCEVRLERRHGRRQSAAFRHAFQRIADRLLVVADHDETERRPVGQPARQRQKEEQSPPGCPPPGHRSDSSRLNRRR